MAQTLVQRVVRVTPELIERGVSCGPDTCPIALALLSAYESVSVGPTFTYLDQGRRHFVLRPTSELAEWMKRFDNGEPVEPIDVAIDLEGKRLWIVPTAGVPDELLSFAEASGDL